MLGMFPTLSSLFILYTNKLTDSFNRVSSVSAVSVGPLSDVMRSIGTVITGELLLPSGLSCPKHNPWV